MTNNDILRSIRYTLDLADHKIAELIKLGGETGRVLEPGEPQRLQRLAVHEWLDAYRVLEAARLGRPFTKSITRAKVSSGRSRMSS